jgi:hypothetical protein
MSTDVSFMVTNVMRMAVDVESGTSQRKAVGIIFPIISIGHDDITAFRIYFLFPSEVLGRRGLVLSPRVPTGELSGGRFFQVT